MIVYAVVDDSLSDSSPLGDAVETFPRRGDAERFIERCAATTRARELPADRGAGVLKTPDWGPPLSATGPRSNDQQKTDTKNGPSIAAPALSRVRTRTPAGIAVRWPTVIWPTNRPVVGPPSVAWYAQVVTSWLKIT